eukprot:scaffold82865_cov68-Phaeocystis_antarctica.AAC.2
MSWKARIQHSWKACWVDNDCGCCNYSEKSCPRTRQFSVRSGPHARSQGAEVPYRTCKGLMWRRV